MTHGIPCSGRCREKTATTQGARHTDTDRLARKAIVVLEVFQCFFGFFVMRV